MLTKPSLTLKRRIKASPAQVYAAWADPKKIVGWFGPTETAEGSVQAQMDVRVGGKYQISYRGKDGEYHQVGGVYREVVPSSRLVFTWAWHTTPERESLVTITVAPDGAGTLFTLHHEQFFDQQARDGHERGWTGTIEKLDRYLTA
jgi:uncharacterized protein YndB with AHSA1/START domain